MSQQHTFYSFIVLHDFSTRKDVTLLLKSNQRSIKYKTKIKSAIDPLRSIIESVSKRLYQGET